MFSHHSPMHFLLVLTAPCVLQVGIWLPPTPGSEPTQARKDLEKAAANGEAEAQYQLGLLMLRERTGGQSDHDAASWFRKAAEQGHKKAQFELGTFLESLGREELHRAERWLTRSAAQGHGPAWLALGDLYARGGLGVLQDQARAQECYQRADANGDAEVWFALGNVYRWGRDGTAEHMPRAFEYYMKAARHGHAFAQYLVGECYQYGLGTAPNLPRAVECYKQAAKLGDDYACEKLGWLYEHGIGVARDREQAIAWYRKCEQHGGFCGFHLLRLKDPDREKQNKEELERERQRARIIKDVEITLEPEKAEYELDDLIIISVRYRNVGNETYSFVEHHRGGFQHEFAVTDADGRRLPNPYTNLRTVQGGSFMSSTHVLEPGKTLVLKKTLNQCVHFEKPGTYTVTRTESLYPGRRGWPNDVDERCRAVGTPLTLKIKNKCDLERRQQDIERLVQAYWAGAGFPGGMARTAERFGGRLDVIRRLVFYNEPKLLPFFLDALEKEDVNRFIEAGLQALPDRAAVLKALEERLDHPEKYQVHRLLRTYCYLAGYGIREFGGEPRLLDDSEDEEKITRRVQGKVLQLLKADKEYQYGRLVPGLLGGRDDLFLIDYLSKSRPNLDLVRQCAWTIQKVKLGPEHIPFLESLLKVERNWSVTDAAMVQLVRLDRARYLPHLKARPENFSPEVVKFLLEPSKD